ncbi:Adenine deaminase [Desulfosporosinus sp. I2]|uniref:adenine deaminase C-terminal domain-containing protein n=1 Tax=Desulfosporosinus sp. I2 TaxID=1617025 RepID=UPI0005EE37A7|nr:adenine deaminase C-terminal domain-containing protein [Desulfosporosinus sp. I2]KJR45508.1 Adenine deaminase [Desulfosporosinus sp. I2]
MKMFIQTEDVLRLQRVALGKEAADLILSGGTVLNVYTGELLQNYEILVSGERIAYVGPDQGFPISPETIRLDVSGQVVIPGLIDAHCHLDYWLGLREFVSFALPRGTTTVITETTEVANGVGIEGVRAFVTKLPTYPLRIFATAPVITFLCSLRTKKPAVSVAEMLEILEYPEILGLGEVYWSRVVGGALEEGLNTLVAKARALSKTVEGHGAGAKNGRLNAFVAYGVDSCHESISSEDVLARLRLGLATMIREGSIRRELETVVPELIKLDIDLRRAILVSDDVWPHHLVKYGHMDYIVNKAIASGLNPITAIQMATLNPAEHFHLDADLGGIAPGKFADLVVIPTIDKIDAQMVIMKGRVVAQQGRLEIDLPAEHYPAQFSQSLRLPTVAPEFFQIMATGISVRARIISMVTEIVNREVLLEMPLHHGLLQLREDILKIAVIDRFEGTGNKALGLIKGYGLRQGALAISASFDEGNVVVVGSNDLDMAIAINHLQELGGGMVYCCDGVVKAEVALPIYGGVSALAGPLVAERLEFLISTLQEMGCHFENPLLTLLTITFTAIPSLRLTIRGYWLSKENRIVELFV